MSEDPRSPALALETERLALVLKEYGDQKLTLRSLLTIVLPILQEHHAYVKKLETRIALLEQRPRGTARKAATLPELADVQVIQ